jgi:hypothetical protein
MDFSTLMISAFIREDLPDKIKDESGLKKPGISTEDGKHFGGIDFITF